ncbi:Imm1 family immunity protein [Kutzneria chonburiensis]|uniref:Imm1 family immunity protein n=1 Tax=Kutzneria chonburiensis TaxID=1483604 RepID=A0ABV6MX98_9PSEU
MILSAVHDGLWKHASTPDEIEALLHELVYRANPRHPSDVVLADTPFDDDSVDQPAQLLRVSANPEAGVAALLWFRNAADGEMWVSYNPHPPLEDPWLASDVDTARYHDRFTAIPLDQAHAALTQFVASGGQRPSNVQWVTGDYYGRITQALTPASPVHAA